ncbi:MAG: alpha-galactosidase, partial [Reinekea sp.]|nr:alpha-galactosidase [Reinekea sp.]
KSHTTSRSHALNVRAGTALFGHLGIEWDIRQANELEQAQLVQLVSLYKDLRNTLHQGIRRPMAGADKHQIAFSVTHNDTTLISIFQQKMPEFSVPASLQISGLDSDHHYAIDILIEAEHTGHLMKRKPSWMHNRTKVFSGEQLMQFGLPLPVMDPESLLVLKLTDC